MSATAFRTLSKRCLTPSLARSAHSTTHSSTTRQLPHDATPTTSPTPHSHHPPPSDGSPSQIPKKATDLAEMQAAARAEGPTDPFAPLSRALRPRPKFTPKGKAIPKRPPHGIKLDLPSGHPAPDSYPPTEEYFSSLKETPDAPHPLWKFFHSPSTQTNPQGPPKDLPMAVDRGSLEVYEKEESNLNSGRSWTAAELRNKSFEDLHTLWYLLLRERNVLATQREERRRLGIVESNGGDLITARSFRCRKSMARIKYVLNERRLALIAAAAPNNTSSAALSLLPPFSSITNRADPLTAAEALATPEGEVRTDILRSPAEDEKPAVVEPGTEGAPEDGVAQEEVEARDEGFGGGQEAQQFVEDKIPGVEGSNPKGSS